jgi:16S rRNA (cytosine1402-N4)-methyltransferase
MRMDTSEELGAAEIVNTWDERRLETTFRHYGEERYARQIARGIVRRRERAPIERTGQLVDVVRASIPAPARFGEGHPAKRVFQALRIEVNHELESLQDGLPAAFEMLRPGGRLAIISFHSLEDRIAKRFLRDRARGCTCPPELPICVCGHEPELRILTPKPLRPSASETGANPRAAAARLRAAVKV